MSNSELWDAYHRSEQRWRFGMPLTEIAQVCFKNLQIGFSN
jgi:hypothetical protein